MKKIYEKTCEILFELSVGIGAGLIIFVKWCGFVWAAAMILLIVIGAAQKIEHEINEREYKKFKIVYKYEPVIALKRYVEENELSEKKVLEYVKRVSAE